MKGIERSYCDVCINALVGAWRTLMESYFIDVLGRTIYGKDDTLGLDAIPELTITHRLLDFDPHAILVTEECDDQNRRRWPTDSDPTKQPLMFFSDPIDGSRELCEFLRKTLNTDCNERVGDRLAQVDAEKSWVSMFNGPASITGPTSSITCIRKGEIIFSVILNFITRTLIVATDVGIFSHTLKDFPDKANEKLTLSEVVTGHRQVFFPGARESDFSPDDCKRFVTFMGKAGYAENFRDSMTFIPEPDKFLYSRVPVGPSRPLYLSDLQCGDEHIGFVLANGEKISEWIHWLAFVKFAKNASGGTALRAFEVTIDRPWTKRGVLMSTAPAYSIFCIQPNANYIDISRLRHFEHPSQFRCMVVVTQYDNEHIIYALEQRQHREITDCF